MDELISRQDAIDAMSESLKRVFPEHRQIAEKCLGALPSAQPEPTTEIQEILNYLDTTLHPIVSPDNWNVYSELYDMVNNLSSAQPDHNANHDKKVSISCNRENDLISRQDAIDAISCDITVTGRQNAELVAKTIGTFADRIKALPTVEPKKAYWVVLETAYEDEEAKCSCCGFSMLVNQPCNGLLRVSELKFCPNCGAAMVHIGKTTNEEAMLRVIDNWRQKPNGY